MRAITVFAPVAADPTRKALTIPEAALELRISERSVARRVADGAIKSVLIGRRRLIPATEVARVLADGCI